MSIKNGYLDSDSDLDSGNVSDYYSCPSNISDVSSDVDSAFDELATVIPQLDYEILEMEAARMDSTFSEDESTVPEATLFQEFDPQMLLKLIAHDYCWPTPGQTFNFKFPPSDSTFSERPVTPPLCGNVQQLQQMPTTATQLQYLEQQQHSPAELQRTICPMNETQSYVDFIQNEPVPSESYVDFIQNEPVPSNDILYQNCSTLIEFIDSSAEGKNESSKVTMTNVTSGNMTADCKSYYSKVGNMPISSFASENQQPSIPISSFASENQQPSMPISSFASDNQQPSMPISSFASENQQPSQSTKKCTSPQIDIRWKKETRPPIVKPVFPRPSSKPRLYNFLTELLSDTDRYTCIEWIDKSNGIFKFVQSAEVARLWGLRKNKPNMKYENFARSLRTYISKGILTKPRNKLVYKFTTKVGY